MANLNFLLDTVKRRIKTSSTINNVNYMLKNLDHNVETENEEMKTMRKDFRYGQMQVKWYCRKRDKK